MKRLNKNPYKILALSALAFAEIIFAGILCNWFIWDLDWPGNIFLIICSFFLILLTFYKLPSSYIKFFFLLVVGFYSVLFFMPVEYSPRETAVSRLTGTEARKFIFRPLKSGYYYLAMLLPSQYEADQLNSFISQQDDPAEIFIQHSVLSDDSRHEYFRPFLPRKNYIVYPAVIPLSEVFLLANTNYEISMQLGKLVDGQKPPASTHPNRNPFMEPGNYTIERTISIPAQDVSQVEPQQSNDTLKPFLSLIPFSIPDIIHPEMQITVKKWSPGGFFRFWLPNKIRNYNLLIAVTTAALVALFASFAMSFKLVSRLHLNRKKMIERKA